MKTKDIVCCWDFLLAVIVTTWITYSIQPRIDNVFARDLYSIGISVLSIIFSVFFAALAIIMSASDDEFALFMEEEGDYTAIVRTLQFSLGALFVALLYSLVTYGLSSAWIAAKGTGQSCWWFVGYCFLFLYSLFAVANATRDSITYSQFRIRFLKIAKAKKDSPPASH